MTTIKIIATPIGNIEDITLRAIKILKEARIIICEDTRNIKKLLNLTCESYTQKKYIVYNDFADANTRNGIIKLAEKEDIVLVSDAGSPLISDPGYKLVKEAIKKNINIECIPGPSSVISGLTLSGLPSDNFLFYGFISSPAKLKSDLKNIKNTIIFFEAANKLLETLNLLQTVFGDINCAVSFEMTKKFEQTFRGNIAEVIKQIHLRNIMKGEVVITIDSRGNTSSSSLYYKLSINEIIKLLLKHNSTKDTLSQMIKLSDNLINENDQTTKIKKNELYNLILEQNNSKNFLGINAEKKAINFLEAQNYQILETRRKTPYGEIDIIAKHNECITFIEVKSSIIKGKAYHAISIKQQANIINSINYLISEAHYSSENIRCDAIIIDQEKIEHIQNAFDWSDE